MSVHASAAVDTSVAVPLLTASHLEHDHVTSALRGRSLTLSGHALAETYSVLTRLPGDARVAPADAVRLIDENFPDPLHLPPDAAATVHRTLAEHGVAGGAVNDGLVAMAASYCGKVLVTRDARALTTYRALGVAVEVLPAKEI